MHLLGETHSMVALSGYFLYDNKYWQPVAMHWLIRALLAQNDYLFCHMVMLDESEDSYYLKAVTCLLTVDITNLSENMMGIKQICIYHTYPAENTY